MDLPGAQGSALAPGGYSALDEAELAAEPTAAGMPQQMDVQARLAAITQEMHNVRQAFHVRAWSKVPPLARAPL